MSDTPNPPSDIPAHWKFYRIYMLVPRQLGMVVTNGENVRCDIGVWEFGKMPAATGLHAINTFWASIAHVGPALLDAEGKPIRKKKIKKSELLVEECSPDAPVIGHA